ncbi:hypothetical protein AVEN_55074-1 [Araneus ventricosus]|uniref:Uncharacterized protein n=1 Tax=Araneus ventricosus TaxID=182803 RepID=A0A4Y2H7T5_ARAVE|nr:hypothetical protein AVEN_55074-1 [Araneus ventricosus]
MHGKNNSDRWLVNLTVGDVHIVISKACRCRSMTVMVTSYIHPSCLLSQAVMDSSNKTPPTRHDFQSMAQSSTFCSVHHIPRISTQWNICGMSWKYSSNSRSTAV